MYNLIDDDGMAQIAYDGVVSALQAKADTIGGGSGGDTSANSPGGLTIGEVVDQAGFADNQKKNAIGVAWEESGGNAGNNINRYKGLFAMGPEAFQIAHMDYSKWNDPIYNATAAMRLQKAQGWAQPWSSWPVSQDSMNRGDAKVYGYTNGGIAMNDQIARVGENGPELFMPIHDPRSVTMFVNQLSHWVDDQKDRARGYNVADHARNQNEVAQQTHEARGHRGGRSDRDLERIIDKFTKRLEKSISRKVDAKIDNIDELAGSLIDAVDVYANGRAGERAWNNQQTKQLKRILAKKGER